MKGREEGREREREREREMRTRLEELQVHGCVILYQESWSGPRPK
jgi:hypothetical protein